MIRHRQPAPQRFVAAALLLATALPSPAYALRAGLEGKTQAGLEAILHERHSIIGLEKAREGVDGLLDRIELEFVRQGAFTQIKGRIKERVTGMLHRQLGEPPWRPDQIPKETRQQLTEQFFGLLEDDEFFPKRILAMLQARMLRDTTLDIFWLRSTEVTLSNYWLTHHEWTGKANTPEAITPEGLDRIAQVLAEALFFSHGTAAFDALQADLLTDPRHLAETQARLRRLDQLIRTSHEQRNNMMTVALPSLPEMAVIALASVLYNEPPFRRTNVYGGETPMEFYQLHRTESAIRLGIQARLREKKLTALLSTMPPEDQLTVPLEDVLEDLSTAAHLWPEELYNRFLVLQFLSTVDHLDAQMFQGRLDVTDVQAETAPEALLEAYLKRPYGLGTIAQGNHLDLRLLHKQLPRLLRLAETDTGELGRLAQHALGYLMLWAPDALFVKEPLVLAHGVLARGGTTVRFRRALARAHPEAIRRAVAALAEQEPLEAFRPTMWFANTELLYLARLNRERTIPVTLVDVLSRNETWNAEVSRDPGYLVSKYVADDLPKVRRIQHALLNHFLSENGFEPIARPIVRGQAAPPVSPDPRTGLEEQISPALRERLRTPLTREQVRQAVEFLTEQFRLPPTNYQAEAMKFWFDPANAKSGEPPVRLGVVAKILSNGQRFDEEVAKAFLIATRLWAKYGLTDNARDALITHFYWPEKMTDEAVIFRIRETAEQGVFRPDEKARTILQEAYAMRDRPALGSVEAEQKAAAQRRSAGLEERGRNGAPPAAPSLPEGFGGLLHPSRIAYLKEVRNLANPDGKLTRWIYPHSGPDASSFLLATDAEVGIFFDEKPWADPHWTEIASEAREEYHQTKRQQGWSFAIQFDSLKFYLLKELELLGAHHILVGKSRQGAVEVTFTWAYPGERPKARHLWIFAGTPYWQSEQSPVFSRLFLEKEFDGYFEKATNSTGSNLSDFARYLRSGGVIISDQEAPGELQDRLEAIPPNQQLRQLARAVRRATRERRPFGLGYASYTFGYHEGLPGIFLWRWKPSPAPVETPSVSSAPRRTGGLEETLSPAMQVIQAFLTGWAQDHRDLDPDVQSFKGGRALKLTIKAPVISQGELRHWVAAGELHLSVEERTAATFDVVLRLEEHGEGLAIIAQGAGLSVERTKSRIRQMLDLPRPHMAMAAWRRLKQAMPPASPNPRGGLEERMEALRAVVRRVWPRDVPQELSEKFKGGPLVTLWGHDYLVVGQFLFVTEEEWSKHREALQPAASSVIVTSLARGALTDRLNFLYGNSTRQAILMLQAHADVLNDQIVFDAGAGDGVLARVALRLGAKKAYALERSQEWVEVLERLRVLQGFSAEALIALRGDFAELQRFPQLHEATVVIANLKNSGLYEADKKFFNWHVRLAETLTPAWYFLLGAEGERDHDADTAGMAADWVKQVGYQLADEHRYRQYAHRRIPSAYLLQRHETSGLEESGPAQMVKAFATMPAESWAVASQTADVRTRNTLREEYVRGHGPGRPVVIDRRQATQLVPGETVRVLEESRGWAMIETLQQPQRQANGAWAGYRGWVQRQFLQPLPVEQPMPPPFSVEPLTLERESTLRRQVVASAQTRLGLPYAWGRYVDCSVLVHLAYRDAGIVIPRDSADQDAWATPLERGVELQPGDIIYLDPVPGKSRFRHVVLYLGDNEVIEARGARWDLDATPQDGVPGVYQHKLAFDVMTMKSGDEIPSGKRRLYFGTFLNSGTPILILSQTPGGLEEGKSPSQRVLPYGTGENLSKDLDASTRGLTMEDWLSGGAVSGLLTSAVSRAQREGRSARILVIGIGTGRLAYDLQTTYPGAQFVFLNKEKITLSDDVDEAAGLFAQATEAQARDGLGSRIDPAEAKRFLADFWTRKDVVIRDVDYGLPQEWVGSFDSVLVSLQTFEYTEKKAELLKEVKRLLQPDGVAWISSCFGFSIQGISLERFFNELLGDEYVFRPLTVGGRPAGGQLQITNRSPGRSLPQLRLLHVSRIGESYPVIQNLYDVNPIQLAERARWRESPAPHDGLEEAGPPPVEILHPEVVQSLNLRGIFFDVDDTLWLGFPEGLYAEVLAEHFGLDVHNTSAMDKFRAFYNKECMGVSWDAIHQAARQHGWTPTFAITEAEYYETRLNPRVWQAIRDENLTDPTRYLTPGSRELLTALQAAKTGEETIHLAIATAADADSRHQVLEELGIRGFFEQVHGGGHKAEDIVAQAGAWGLTAQRAHRVAHLGDRPSDVRAAHQAGVVAIGFARTPEDRARFLQMRPDDEHPENYPPDLIINGNFSSVTEILAALRLSGVAAGLEEGVTRRGGFVLTGHAALAWRAFAERGLEFVVVADPARAGELRAAGLEEAHLLVVERGVAWPEALAQARARLNTAGAETIRVLTDENLILRITEALRGARWPAEAIDRFVDDIVARYT